MIICLTLFALLLAAALILSALGYLGPSLIVAMAVAPVLHLYLSKYCTSKESLKDTDFDDEESYPNEEDS